MTRRALFAMVAGAAGVCARRPDPEYIDDENPEFTPEDMARARPAAEVLPGLIGQKATDELMRGNVRVYAEAEAAIHWSQCPSVESVPGRLSGAWVLRDTRMPVSGIIDNWDAGGSARDIMECFELTREQVETVIDYARG